MQGIVEGTGDKGWGWYNMPSPHEACNLVRETEKEQQQQKRILTATD